MSLIQSIFQIIHHSQAAHLSQLDIFLYIIKGFISLCGSLVILMGVITGIFRFLMIIFFKQKKKFDFPGGMDYIRRDLGRTIILGLEFIVAADVIETTTTPDYYSLGILGIIVVIRTFLSFALNREIAELTPSKRNMLES